MHDVYSQNVEEQIAVEAYSKLEQDVTSMRIAALLSETENFLVIAALTEIELHESLDRFRVLRWGVSGLPEDAQKFYLTPTRELEAEDVFGFYSGEPIKSENDPASSDNFWGNIAILLAKARPDAAFKCLAKIISDEDRIALGSMALFQQPANMNIRELIRLSFIRHVAADGKNYGALVRERLSPDYAYLIHGLAGDRAAAERALSLNSIHSKCKQRLRGLYGIKGPERESRFERPQPYLIDRISEMHLTGIEIEKRGLSKKEIQTKLSKTGTTRTQESSLKLALAILDHDPGILLDNDLNFSFCSNILGAAAIIDPLASHGVGAFAIDKETQELNVQRDWNNWARVKLDVDTGNINAETVMRVLAIPPNARGYHYGFDLRVSAEQMVGINK